MTITKASGVDFDYPLVGFSRAEGVLCYDDFHALTNCSIVYVDQQTLIGMELVDNRLRRWIVRSLDVRELPKAKRWWQIFSSPAHVEFDLDLEEIEPVMLSDLKARLLEKWELEDPDVEKAVRSARDLAAMFEAGYVQGSGLL